jgi:outer membrane protein assembly factor BamB
MAVDRDGNYFLLRKTGFIDKFRPNGDSVWIFNSGAASASSVIVHLPPADPMDPGLHTGATTKVRTDDPFIVASGTAYTTIVNATNPFTGSFGFTSSAGDLPPAPVSVGGWLIVATGNGRVIGLTNSSLSSTGWSTELVDVSPPVEPKAVTTSTRRRGTAAGHGGRDGGDRRGGRGRGAGGDGDDAAHRFHALAVNWLISADLALGVVAKKPVVLVSGKQPDGKGRVYALRPWDGSLVWYTKLTFPHAPGAAPTMTADGQGILVGLSNDGGVARLDPETGDQQWLMPSFGFASAVGSWTVVGGFATPPAGSKPPYGSLAWFGTESGMVFGMDTDTALLGKVLWSFQTGDAISSVPAVMWPEDPTRRFIVSGSHDTTIRFFDPMSGELKHLRSLPSAIVAAPLIAPGGDVAIVATRGGKVYSVSLRPTYVVTVTPNPPLTVPTGGQFQSVRPVLCVMPIDPAVSVDASSVSATVSIAGCSCATTGGGLPNGCAQAPGEVLGATVSAGSTSVVVFSALGLLGAHGCTYTLKWSAESLAASF